MNKKGVIIIGAGGHGKVLLDTLLELGACVLGFLDNDVSLQSQNIYNVPILGTDEDICHFNRQEIELVNGIGSIGVATVRRRVFEKFKEQGYHFRQVIHPSAVVSSRVSLGEGVQVLAGTVINIGSRIEDDAIINTRASVDHDCHIGKHVHVAPGCILSGMVSIGDESHIGTGCSVIQGVFIGNRVLIGAGSNVIRNVKNDVVIFGNPAM